jgi:hemoglobin/transferrin/lactoferrin receptor protein
MVMSLRLRPTLLAVSIAAGLSNTAVAEEVDSTKKALDMLVVSGSRIEQEIDKVPATITTVTAEEIERENPADLEDLLQYEAGVSVRSQPNRSSGVFRSVGRAGNEGVNVRGLEGDQVRLQVDGVKLPMSYSSGPYAAGRGDVIDPEGYKRVEILRGSASTQFGSDGLGGAVSFLTKDPRDLLTLGKDFQTNLKTGYTSANEAWQLAPSFAFRSGIWEGMLLASLRRGHETETMGENNSKNVNRTAANPSDRESDYLLAKLVAQPSDGHQVKLTVETMDGHNETEVFTFFGDPFAAATLTGVDTTEEINRDLFKVDYQYAPATASWFDVANVTLYSQESLNIQTGRETRSDNPLLRIRETRYGEDTLGSSIQLQTLFDSEGKQRLVYGVDVALSDVYSFKDGYNSPQDTSVSGCTPPSTTCSPFVENKSFPDSDYDTLGAFVQADLAFGEQGRGNVSPGLRYERYELTPQADKYYRVNNTAEPSKLEDDELSPRLGASWTFVPMAQLYGQYSHGFRAPKPSQVNGGVTNLTTTSGSGPYTALGNPDLKAETSNVVEVGVRGRDAGFHYSVALFKGKYKDFIVGNVMVQENVDLGLGTLVDVFQSQNLNNVTIEGFEARTEWAFYEGWRLNAAYAHAKGESETGGKETPLATIDPDKLVLGMSFASGKRWGTSTTVTAVERKHDQPDKTIYTSPGFATVDLSAWYAFTEATRLNAGVGNLFDKKYVEWADVRDLAETSTAVDGYTQPGRNVSVSLVHSF